MKRVSKLCLLLLFLFTLSLPTFAWKAGYAHRKTLAIPVTQVDADLAYFSVRVDIINDADFADCQADGDDVIFTATDDSDLYFEILNWSTAESQGDGIFYVLVPVVDHDAPTEFYCYYENAEATKSAYNDPTKVFDTANGCVAAWHLEEASNPYLDATSNNNDSTTGTYPTQVAGQIGFGQDFELDNSQYIGIPDHNSLDGFANCTLSVWINAESIAGDMDIYQRGSSSDLPTLRLRTAGLQFIVETTSTYAIADSNSSLSAATPYHVTGVYDGANVLLYINSVLQTDQPALTGTVKTSSEISAIGRQGSDSARYFDGLIDEVRLSNIARSAAWVKFEFYNSHDGHAVGNEISWGSEEDAPVENPSASLLALGIMTTTVGKDWFVRPAGGSYGSEDGTSYANAWDGLLNIVWGSEGVQSGDTLYVCGLHIHNITDEGDIKNHPLGTISGGGESSRIIIRGDYPGDNGIVWRTYKASYESWVDEGDYVWSITIKGSPAQDWFFEDITADSWVVLDKETTLVGCQGNAGSFYSATFGNGTKLYVHCSDDGNPTGRIYINRYGYNFALTGGKSYITFLNIKLYNDAHGGMYNIDDASHITFDGCAIAYGENELLPIYTGCDYIVVNNCELSWAGNGVYLIAGAGDAGPAHCTITNNIIHDMGVRTFFQNSDAHAVGVMGGHDILVSGNTVYNCGSAFVFYSWENQDQYANIVSYNFIRDCHTYGGANGYAIEWSGDATQVGDHSNNKTYYNIISGCTVGIRHKQSTSDLHKIYNNIVRNATNISYWIRNSSGAELVELYNNISINPTNYHIMWENAAVGDYLKSDYNIFYPVSGSDFYFETAAKTWAQWQTLSQADFIFDPNSLTSDPLFINAGGSYDLATDFKIPSNSPAREAGTDVGLTEDYWGTSIPQGTYPDIGVHEYGETGIVYGAGEFLGLGILISSGMNYLSASVELLGIGIIEIGEGILDLKIIKPIIRPVIIKVIRKIIK